MSVGYVLKHYPRYSETFIVNEILAHEEAGLPIEIFALRPPSDTHFQDAIARVRAPVNYLPHGSIKLADFWTFLKESQTVLPGLWEALEAENATDVSVLYQAILLARQVRLKGIAHLHAHFATVATSVARLAALFSGVTYSFTAHAKDIYHESVQPDELHCKLRDARAIITVSEYNLAYLRQTYGSAAANVQRIYNGLDLARFAYQSPRDRPPKIAAVGRLVEKKGFSVLIDACAMMAQQGRDFTCQIIGTGELREDLLAQIQHLELQSRVELVGPRPQSDVISHVQSAAVLAAPCVIGADSNRDGLPTVLLEAMALGTPCVSTDVTGIPEVLRDGITGLVTPQHDPELLAEALARLLADAELRVRLASNARRLIESECDIRQTTAQLRELFFAADLLSVPAHAMVQS
jgi:colanic acid/amylovoran biosynthesis glycosyltransferase